MRGMTHRATEAILGHMTKVLGEAGVGQHLHQVVTLRTHPIGPVYAQVRIGKRIRDRPSRRQRLAKLVIAFQKVGIHRTMRSVGTAPSELPIVVTVMAIGAEEAIGDRA